MSFSGWATKYLMGPRNRNTSTNRNTKVWHWDWYIKTFISYFSNTKYLSVADLLSAYMENIQTQIQMWIQIHLWTVWHLFSAQVELDQLSSHLTTGWSFRPCNRIIIIWWLSWVDNNAPVVLYQIKHRQFKKKINWWIEITSSRQYVGTLLGRCLAFQRHQQTKTWEEGNYHQVTNSRERVQLFHHQQKTSMEKLVQMHIQM